MLPEQKNEMFFKMKYKLDSILFKRKYNKIGFYINQYDLQKLSTMAIWDALEYYNIDLNTFWEYVNIWPKYEQDLWNKSGSPDEFYNKWNNYTAVINSCANIANQSLYNDLYQIVAFFFSKKGIYIDYGCGTGTLSLGLKINKRINGNLILLDVSNDVQNFIKFRIKKHELNNEVEFIDVATFEKFFFADGLLCIDVLEHIENSSKVFIDKISPLIRKGGLLIMRAPWRGQLTHLNSAADNFYYGGGRKYLSQHYKEIMRFSTNDIACVYRKL